MNAMLKIGILGAAAYYFANKLSDLDKKIGVKINSVSFNKPLSVGAAFFKLFFNVNLTLENNSALQGDIKGGVIYLYVKDKLLATVNIVNKISIPANGKVPLSIPVGINTLSIVPTVTEIVNIIKAGGGSITMGVKGSVLTSFGKVDIYETKTVSL